MHRGSFCLIERKAPGQKQGPFPSRAGATSLSHLLSGLLPPWPYIIPLSGLTWRAVSRTLCWKIRVIQVQISSRWVNLETRSRAFQASAWATQLLGLKYMQALFLHCLKPTNPGFYTNYDSRPLRTLWVTKGHIHCQYIAYCTCPVYTYRVIHPGIEWVPVHMGQNAM